MSFLQIDFDFKIWVFANNINVSMEENGEYANRNSNKM